MSKKYKSLEIRLYEDQFEVWEVDGKKMRGTEGCFSSNKKSEVIVAMGVFIDHFMRIRRDRPLILKITEGIYMPISEVKKPS